MSFSQNNCFFHPDRPAVDKCEKCQRMICLEDKMTYRQVHVDYGDSVYTFCPICYNQFLQGSKKAGKLFLVICIIFGLFVIGFFAVFILITMNMFSNFSNFPG